MNFFSIIFLIIYILLETTNVISEKSLSLKYCFKCQEENYKSKEICKKCPAAKILNNLHILTPDETLDEIIFKNKSIARFGDNSSNIIKERLLEILNSNEENLLIGLWNQLSQNYRNKKSSKRAKRFWDYWVKKYKYRLVTLIDVNKTYGSTAMSRFYIGHKDRSHVGDYVKKLKMIWDNKDIVMIEGEKTRLGLGNDLFNNTKSIQRILCPNNNAFDVYDKIYNEALKLDKDKLIITALGPTATILAYDLYKVGYQTIDIGHVDLEYEWYLRNSTRMVKIENKHVCQVKGGTVDIDDNVQDKNYNKQIIAKILN
eukprot:jgi/Orpsp1_1/1179205/evm.model.c7180000068410.1